MRFRLLLATLGVMLFAVYGTLAVLILAMSGGGSSDIAPGEESAAPLSPVTASLAYPAAFTAAENWQADAQLVSATASWPDVTSEEDLDRAVAWGYTFLSPQTRQIQVVSVSPQGTEAVQTVNAGPKTRSTDVTSWQVDSEEVLRLFLDNGGRDFLEQHPGATVTLRVALEEDAERLVWYAMGIYSPDRATLVVSVDASTGELLGVTP